LNTCIVPRNDNDMEGIYKYIAWPMCNEGMPSTALHYLETLYLKSVTWVKIESTDDLPKHGRKVIAFYKNRAGRSRRVMAQHFESYTRECNCEHECDCHYSELKDCYYYPEGWYELFDNCDEWSFMSIEGEVTHWMQLPNNPQVAR